VTVDRRMAGTLAESGNGSASGQNDLIHIYGQLVDRTGRPAAGLGLELNADKGITLGVTASDGNGAFVLTLRAALVKSVAGNVAGNIGDRMFHLLINGNAKPLAVTGLVGLKPGVHGPVQIVVANAPPNGTGVAPVPTLLGDDEELLNAFKRAPWLFTKPQPAQPVSTCSPYTPPTAATRVFYYSQIAMFAPRLLDEVLPDQRARRPQEQPERQVTAIDITATPQAPASAYPRFGAILEFRQDWWEAGYGLGDLLYSVPLAPCEETKIATVDWRRRDWATKQTALSESAFQDTTIQRDEAISETARMIADKTLHSSDVGGGASLSLGIISGGLAGQISDMHSTTDATTTASRSINDKIHQVSNTIRNTRSFAIVETTQQEDSTVQSRVLRNHNHCHTVTFQYYQVLRHYLLATQLNAQPRPALFLPFKPINFTIDSVRQYAYVLRRALLDPTLEPVLDMFLGVLPMPLPTPGYPSPTPGSPAAANPNGQAQDLVGELVTSAFVTYQKPPAVGFSNSADTPGWPSDVKLVLNDQVKYASPTSPAGVVPQTAHYQPAAINPPDDSPSLSSINHIGIANRSEVDYYFDDLTITAVVNGNRHEILFQSAVDLKAGRVLVLERAGGPAVSQSTSAAIPGLDRLLPHLNANSLYYTSALIAAGDSSLRYLLLASSTDAAGNYFSDLVDNTVVGFIGNYVGFPLRDPNYLPAQYRTDVQVDLPKTRNERLITMPSPGVFAESQLGQCQACEVIDNTRFWDWTKSPCPDDAPDITAAMLASRNQDLSGLLQVPQSNLQPPAVQIPTEPEPMIKIGDATLANLTKDLQVNDTKGLLELVKGLAQLSSDNYKATLDALTSSQGSLQSGQGGLSAAGSGAGSAAGASALGGSAGAGDLIASAVVALV
jgi:hypothetical protein